MAIETSDYRRWVDLSRFSDYTGLLIYDIKLMDHEERLSFAGGDLDLILEKFSKE